MWRDLKAKEIEDYDQKAREHNLLREIEYKKLNFYFPRFKLILYLYKLFLNFIELTVFSIIIIILIND